MSVKHIVDFYFNTDGYSTKHRTELDTEDEDKAPPAKATRKEKKKRGRKPKIKKLQHSRHALLHVPDDMPEWEGRGVGMAETFNLSDMNQLLKLNKHLYSNGQWELFTTPNKEAVWLYAELFLGIWNVQKCQNVQILKLLGVLCRNK